MMEEPLTTADRLRSNKALHRTDTAAGAIAFSFGCAGSVCR